MKNWNTGGISDSKRQGSQNSSYTLKNCQIHEDPGVLKCYEDLVTDGTGTKPDEEIVAIVNATKNNFSYFFGASGSVWVRNESDVYSLLGEVPAGGNYNRIWDAEEFGGDIYYTMDQRLGKYTPGDAWNTSTVDATQNNFKNITFDLYHPVKVVQNDLYVGNDNQVGKVTPDEIAGGDITQVLTLDTSDTIQSFGAITRYLIVGTVKIKDGGQETVDFSKIYKWDLVSDTFTSEQEIKERGINAFIEHNGGLLFNAGKDGMLYSYDGQFARKFRRIPGSFTNDTTVALNASSAIDGITMFGVSQSGVCGVYSLGGFDAKHIDVLNLPFAMTNQTISAIAWAGTDFLVAHNVVGKIKKLDTDLATAETETLIQSLESSDKRNVAVVPYVDYEIYPGGTNIQLYQSINRGNYVEIPLDDNPSEKQLRGRTVANAREVQYKLILTPDGTNTPIIEFFGN